MKPAVHAEDTAQDNWAGVTSFFKGLLYLGLISIGATVFWFLGRVLSARDGQTSVDAARAGETWAIVGAAIFAVLTVTWATKTNWSWRVITSAVLWTFVAGPALVLTYVAAVHDERASNLAQSSTESWQHTTGALAFFAGAPLVALIPAARRERLSTWLLLTSLGGVAWMLRAAVFARFHYV